MVLSKNEVKNGAITRTKKILRYFPDLKAIIYASGYAIAKANIVAKAAYTKDLKY